MNNLYLVRGCGWHLVSNIFINFNPKCCLFHVWVVFFYVCGFHLDFVFVYACVVCWFLRVIMFMLFILCIYCLVYRVVVFI